MSEVKVHPVKAHIAQHALLDEAGYQAMYRQSIEDPDAFWGEQGKQIDWIKPYTKVKNTSYDPGHISIKWFEDGTLNLSANCIDRHLATRADEVAIIWEGDSPEEDKKVTYRELHEQVCRFANVLKAQGVKQGRRGLHLHADGAGSRRGHAGLYPHRRRALGGVRRLLPRSPGQPHHRLQAPKVVITADEGLRGGRRVALKANVDEALTNPKVDPGGKGHRLQAHRRQYRLAPAPGHLVA
jgi:acetyl-CoA synthetase